MQESPFIQGQEVRHKTGGPIMIVDHIYNNPQSLVGKFQVSCSWYVNAQEFKHETFGLDCLIPVSYQPATQATTP